MNVKELEARFKEIDKRADLGPVAVSLKGATKSSAKLNVVAPRKGAVKKAAGKKAAKKAGGKKAAAKKGGGKTAGALSIGSAFASRETVLDINLADIKVSDKYIAGKLAAVLSNDETVGGLAGVKVMQLGAGGDYQVVEDYTYDAGAYRITALNGFVYDRASIPRAFWVIIDKDDLSNVPPLFHDLLYRSGGTLPKNQVSPHRTFTRKDVDDLFLELMLKSGVRRWRATLAYQAVRKFAAAAWKG